MAQVIRPQPQNNNGLNEILPIAGAVVGGIYGGPQGAVAGAGAGQMAGGILNPQKPGAPTADSGGSEAAAMARKQAQMGQDNLEVLKQAEAHLPSLPEDMRQQYAPAIIQARMLEQQKRGMA